MENQEVMSEEQIDAQIDAMTLDGAVASIGKKLIEKITPEQKILAWMRIGKEIAQKQEQYGVKTSPTLQYRNWLTESGVRKAVAREDISRASAIYRQREKIFALRAGGLIPGRWANPARIVDALAIIERGEDPREAWKARNKSVYRKQLAKESDFSAPYWAGKEFRDLMTKLPTLTAEERVALLVAFCGTEASGISAETANNGSITVKTRHPDKPPRDVAVFELKIKFIKADAPATAAD
jgi:hypothetical protein